MKILLMHPPLDDPTIPYHSTAYLAGHLVHSGFADVRIRDMNVEYVNWCLDESRFHRYYEEAQRRRREFEGRESLDYWDQEAYYSLWVPSELTYDSVAKAVAGMRDPETLLDWEAYKDNVDVLLRYFGLLGALSYPSEIFNFKQYSRGRYSAYCLRDLLDADLTRRICLTFDHYIDERVVDDSDVAEADCLGISVPYDHQIFHALHLARRLRKLFPDKKILMGGTSISQLYKYLKDKQDMKRFLSLCDGIVVGEGETAICEIADAGDVFPGMPIRNLVTYEASNDRLHLPPHIHYENVIQLGRPLYRYPWELYLSPDRGINYSPTRGCYWNRCTFCDYGLNTDKPTSPWRERRIEQVIEDLGIAIREHGLGYVYFAVDVMSPKYLDRLSDAIADSELDFSWSAELRMEKVFSPERCKRMSESGCVCVSFGMESGNQRVLDLIDKGTRVEYMGTTMKNFSDVGIAVQLMAFTDFPTETQTEKEETHRFVKDHDDYWATGGIGTFLLTGTAIVAKDPERFGVKLVDTVDADVHRAVDWNLLSDEAEGREGVRAEDSDASFDFNRGLFPEVLGRPWAGATDTLHTMIYYRRHGKRFFREHPLQPDRYDGYKEESNLLKSGFSLFGRMRESVFDIARIIERRKEYMQYLKRLAKVPQEPTLKSFREWGADRQSVRRNADGPSYWLRCGDKCVQLDALLYRLIEIGLTHKLTVAQLVGSLEGDTRERILRFFLELGEKELLVFHDPARPPRDRKLLPSELRQAPGDRSMPEAYSEEFR